MFIYVDYFFFFVLRVFVCIFIFSDFITLHSFIPHSHSNFLLTMYVLRVSFFYYYYFKTKKKVFILLELNT